MLVLAGGHAADHANRRLILVTMACVEAGCAAALLWFSVAGITRPWPIYVATAVFGASRAFWAPAMQAYLVNIVSRDHVASAVAFDSTLRQTATIGGPALGGVLYLWGPQLVYALLCALFLGTALLTLFIRTVPPPRARSAGAGRVRDLLEGIRFVLGRRVLLGCISLDLFAVLFGGAVALLPAYAADILHVGPIGLGLLRSAPAIGAAIVGATLAVRPIHHHAGVWLFGGVTVFGLATLVFGVSTAFWLSMIALTVAGAGDMISVFVRLTLTQLSTPDAIRGRVSAVNSMFIGASNELGAFESGVMARWFGTVPSVLIGGCATLVVVAAWLLLFPQLRRVPPLR
jgi:MFS family permease